MLLPDHSTIPSWCPNAPVPVDGSRDRLPACASIVLASVGEHVLKRLQQRQASSADVHTLVLDGKCPVTILSALAKARWNMSLAPLAEAMIAAMPALQHLRIQGPGMSLILSSRLLSALLSLGVKASARDTCLHVLQSLRSLGVRGATEFQDSPRLLACNWLPVMPMLQHLDIADVRAIDGLHELFGQALASLRHLTSLRLASFRVPGPRMRSLFHTGLPALPQLTHLVLDDSVVLSEVPDDALVAAFAALCNLQTLVLRQIDMHDRHVSRIAGPLMQMHQLQNLDLSGNRNVTTASVHTLATHVMPGVTQLKSLDLHGCGIAETSGFGQLLQQLATQPSLVFASLAFQVPRMAGELTSADAPRLCAVRSLDLSGNKLNAAFALSFSAHAASRLRVLQHLDLGFNPLRDDGVTFMADAVLKMHQLETLCLRSCRAVDALWPLLWNLRRLKHFANVDVSGNFPRIAARFITEYPQRIHVDISFPPPLVAHPYQAYGPDPRACTLAVNLVPRLTDLAGLIAMSLPDALVRAVGLPEEASVPTLCAAAKRCVCCHSLFLGKGVPFARMTTLPRFNAGSVVMEAEMRPQCYVTTWPRELDVEHSPEWYSCSAPSDEDNDDAQSGTQPPAPPPPQQHHHHHHHHHHHQPPPGMQTTDELLPAPQAHQMCATAHWVNNGANLAVLSANDQIADLVTQAGNQDLAGHFPQFHLPPTLVAPAAPGPMPLPPVPQPLLLHAGTTVPSVHDADWRAVVREGEQWTAQLDKALGTTPTAPPPATAAATTTTASVIPATTTTTSSATATTTTTSSATATTTTTSSAIPATTSTTTTTTTRTTSTSSPSTAPSSSSSSTAAGDSVAPEATRVAPRHEFQMHASLARMFATSASPVAPATTVTAPTPPLGVADHHEQMFLAFNPLGASNAVSSMLNGAHDDEDVQEVPADQREA